MKIAVLFCFIAAAAAASAKDIQSLFLQVQQGQGRSHAENGQIVKVVDEMIAELNAEHATALKQLLEHEVEKNATVAREEAAIGKSNEQYNEFKADFDTHNKTIGDELILLQKLIDYVKTTFKASMDVTNNGAVVKDAAQTTVNQDAKDQFHAKSRVPVAAEKMTKSELLELLKGRVQSRQNRRLLGADNVMALMEIASKASKLDSSDAANKENYDKLFTILEQFEKKLNDEKKSWDDLHAQQKSSRDTAIKEATARILEGKKVFMAFVDRQVAAEQDRNKQLFMLAEIKKIVAEIEATKLGGETKTSADSAAILKAHQDKFAASQVPQVQPASSPSS